MTNDGYVVSPDPRMYQKEDSGSELTENMVNLHQFSKEQMSEVNPFLNDLTVEASEEVSSGIEEVPGPANCGVVAVYTEEEENANDGWNSSWFFK